MFEPDSIKVPDFNESKLFVNLEAADLFRRNARDDRAVTKYPSAVDEFL